MTALQMWWWEHKEQVIRVALNVARVAAGAAILGGLGYGVARYRLPHCGGWFRPPCVACPELAGAIAARSAGQYDQVAKMVADGLRAEPNRPCWRDFEKQFDAPLELTVKPTYLPGRKGVGAPAPELLRLTTNDPYYLLVTPRAKAYVYLFQVDSDGNLTVIFPNKKNTASTNPLPPGEQRIPGTTHFLTVGPRPGREHLLLVAANWEIPELQRIADAGAKGQGVDRKELGRELLARYAIEEKYEYPTPGRSRHFELKIDSLGAPPQVAEK